MPDSNPSSIAGQTDPESVPQRTTRRMAREAGGLQVPKLQWSSRGKSPRKDSYPDSRSLPGSRERERERVLETSDGLQPQTEDPRKNALKNSLNRQASPSTTMESTTRSHGRGTSSKKSVGEVGSQIERSGRIRQRQAERKDQGEKVQTNMVDHEEDEENPFLETKQVHTRSRAGPSNARRVLVSDAGEDRGSSTDKATDSLRSRHDSHPAPARRIRSNASPTIVSNDEVASRPSGSSNPTSSARRLATPTHSRETISRSPSAVRVSSHQTSDQSSSRKSVTRVVSPEKRSKILKSTPHRAEEKFQISNTSEDALKRIERRLQSHVKSSSKYQSKSEDPDSDVEDRGLQRRRGRDQSSPSKRTNQDLKEHGSPNPNSRFSTFPSTSSFGEGNDSIQSLTPTTPSPGGLSPSSPNTFGNADKMSPIRRNDYFGRMNSSPSKLIDLQSLKPSPGKAKRGCFKEEESSDEESQLPTQPPPQSHSQSRVLTSRPGRDDSVMEKNHEQNAETVDRKTRSRPLLKRNESTQCAAAASSSSTTTTKDPTQAVPKLSSVSSETSRTLAEIEAALKRFKESSSPRKRTQVPPQEKSDEAVPSESESRSTRSLSPHRKWAEERRNQNMSSINKPAKDMMENPFARNRPEGGIGSSFMDQLKKADRKRREEHGANGGIKEQSVSTSRGKESGELKEERVRVPYSMAEINRREENMSKIQEESLLRLEEEKEKERKRLSRLRTERRRSVPAFSSSSSNANEFEDVNLSSDKPAADSFAASSIETSPSKEEKRAAKAARRKSLYTYTPTKKDDWINATKGLDSELHATSDIPSTSTVSGNGLSVAEIHPSRRLAVPKSNPSLDDTPSPAKQPSPTRSRSKSIATKSSSFLKGLVILVDVRDQDGSDAASCWVEMLKAVGARVYVKPPSNSSKNFNKVTHIVYKAGKNITRTYYRELDQQFKPLVVGVGWCSKCMELGRKVDEKEYIVELGKEAIFSQNRPISMAAKLAPDSSPLTSSKLALNEASRLQKLVNAPVVPSPLARKCYNAGDITSSTVVSQSTENEDASLIN